MLSVVKAIDGTGSTQLLMVAVVPAIVMAFVWPRNRAWARRWLIGAGALLLMLTLPIVANALASPLEQRDVRYRQTPGALDALIIFDGDNRRGRLRAAKDLFDASAPHDVWVLGIQPEWFIDELPPAGIPADRTRYDITTDTTRAQVDWLARYRRDRPDAAVAVVVSRLQAARVAGLAAAMGLSDVAIVSAEVNREPAAHGAWQIVPSGVAWRVSRDALYEHAALAYYARNGWIDR